MDDEGNSLAKPRNSLDSISGFEEADLMKLDRESIAKLKATYREESMVIRRNAELHYDLDLPTFPHIF